MTKNITYWLTILIITISIANPGFSFDLTSAEMIRLNQVGYYPNQSKKAIVLKGKVGLPFYLMDTSNEKEVFSGTLISSGAMTLSGINSFVADFSGFTQTGSFILVIPSVGKSAPFRIEKQVYHDLGIAAMKAYYFQRASTELQPEFAGIWARAAGHPDNQVQIHPSAADKGRPTGTIVAAPKGWYDAGDYNKYIVNSGITMGTLFSFYEDYPEHAKSMKLNIPASQNALPDYLEELLWNLEWMLAMQDPQDGGVYHKLTTAKFEGMVMPAEAVNQRYFVAKSTAAALNFAAVMAQASRIYTPYLPDLASQCLQASEKAWNWAMVNPQVLYEQNEMNENYNPAIVTGDYGNKELNDEWIWAAAELFVSTQNEEYLSKIEKPDALFKLPSWQNVQWLGYYSLLRHQKNLSKIPQELVRLIKYRMLLTADEYVKLSASNAYHTTMSLKDFIWGSNSVAANQGVFMLQAYLLNKDKRFLNVALDNLDYLLGKNATGYAYVTGFGEKSPINPHHRPSEAEPEKAPVPGFLVGGPNPGQQDGCTYDSRIPDESYTDQTCSYASNEVAINWNAPLVYLVNAIEAILK
jgi:endoglucanase